MKRNFEDILEEHAAQRRQAKSRDSLNEFLITSSKYSSDNVLDLQAGNGPLCESSVASITADAMASHLLISSSSSCLPLYRVASSALTELCKEAFSSSELMNAAQKSILDSTCLVLEKLCVIPTFSKLEFVRSFFSVCSPHAEAVYEFMQRNIFTLRSIVLASASQPGAMKSLAQHLVHCCEEVDNGTFEYRQKIVRNLVGQFTELGYCEISDESTSHGDMRKVCRVLLDTIGKKFLSCSKTDINVYEQLLAGSFDSFAVKQLFSRHLSLVLSHKAVITVSGAVQQQSKWTFARSPTQLTDTFAQLLIVLGAEAVFALMKRALEEQEVNWRHVLTCLSTALVCEAQSASLLTDMIDKSLSTAFEFQQQDQLICALLLARQGCSEGPHVFMDYSHWFRVTFSSEQGKLNSKKSYEMLVKLLTDLVPYEAVSHLKAHLHNPPTPPPKCATILSDYIMLAKTRLNDLEGSASSLEVHPSSDAGKTAIDNEVIQAVEAFAETGRISTRIMQMSIFRKLHYVGKFLPVLLKSRALPDVADDQMKFIDALFACDKIPAGTYSAYKESCKRVTNQLLEGVFEDSENETEMLQTPLEQLSSSLFVLKTSLSNDQCSFTSELSTIRVKIQNALQSTASSVAKMAEVLLNAICEILHEVTRMDWLRKMVLMLLEEKLVWSGVAQRLEELLSDQLGVLDDSHLNALSAFLLQAFNEDEGKAEMEGLLLHMESNALAEHSIKILRFSCCCLMFMAKSKSKGTNQSLDLPSRVSLWFRYFSCRFISSCRHGYALDSCMPHFEFSQIVESICLMKACDYLYKDVQIEISDWIRFESALDPHYDLLSSVDRRDFYAWIVWSMFVPRHGVSPVIASMFHSLMDVSIQTRSSPRLKCQMHSGKKSLWNSAELILIMQKLVASAVPPSSPLLHHLLHARIKKIKEEGESDFSLKIHIVITSWFRLCQEMNPAFFFAFSSDADLGLVASTINDHLGAECFCGIPVLGQSNTWFLLQGLIVSDGLSEEFLSKVPLLVSSIVALWPYLDQLAVDKQSLCNRFPVFERIGSTWKSIQKFCSSGEKISAISSDICHWAALLFFVHIRDTSVEIWVLDSLRDMMPSAQFSLLVWNFQICCLIEIAHETMNAQNLSKSLDFLASVWIRVGSIELWQPCDELPSILMSSLPDCIQSAFPACCISAMMRVARMHYKQLTASSNALHAMLSWHVYVNHAYEEDSHASDQNFILTIKEIREFSGLLKEVIECTSSHIIRSLPQPLVSKTDPQIQKYLTKKL